MQNLRKILRPILLPGGVALLLVSTFGLASAVGHRHGTDILHLFSRTSMANDGVVNNASGRVDLAQNKQGNANNQNLAIVVRNLETNGTYQLLALVDDDTNFVQVSEFHSDAAGRASLIYRKVGSSHGHGQGLGHGKLALPAVLDPISQIRASAISLNSTQTVLHADLTDPDKLAYLVKRDLGTNGVDASLRIFATVQQTQFRLAVFGLAAGNDYLLALNGGVVQTNSADAKGRLLINSLVDSPVDILDLHSVALWDSASNVVLRTALP
jgi:hypothetical protein